MLIRHIYFLDDFNILVQIRPAGVRLDPVTEFSMIVTTDFLISAVV